jgi:hypothetical protein
MCILEIEIHLKLHGAHSRGHPAACDYPRGWKRYLIGTALPNPYARLRMLGVYLALKYVRRKILPKMHNLPGINTS